MLYMLYGNSCSIADRERVIGPALAFMVEEFISDCSKEADSGTVNINDTDNLIHHGTLLISN